MSYDLDLTQREQASINLQIERRPIVANRYRPPLSIRLVRKLQTLTPMQRFLCYALVRVK